MATKTKQPKKTTGSKKPAAKPSAKIEGASMAVVGTDGTAKGRISLPKELFDAKVNQQLMAQAVRVYLANQRQGTAKTKTRGEVEGSTRKIYRQKGTGRARHGAIRAPIFVGGGIVFGPIPRDYSLKLPEKMRRAALASALTSQYQAGNISIVDGLEDLEPKTKVFAKTFELLSGDTPTLLVTSGDAKSVLRGVRNLSNVDMLPVTSIHTYTILAHKKIVFMKPAIAQLKA